MAGDESGNHHNERDQRVKGVAGDDPSAVPVEKGTS
jgi:hypothetical protein